MKITRRQLRKILSEQLGVPASKKIVELEISYAFILTDIGMRIVLPEFDQVADVLVDLKSQGYTHVFSHEEKSMFTIDEMIQSFDDYGKHVHHYASTKTPKTLMEIRIKPNIPNVPSAEAQEKIDDLARSQDFKDSADVMAHTFGYPEGRSYSQDLKDYDDIAKIPHIERLKSELVHHIIDIYDEEVHDYSLDKHIYNTMNKTAGEHSFESFLKILARDIYTHISRKYHNLPIPHPFDNKITIHGADAIHRIYRALVEGSELI